MPLIWISGGSDLFDRQTILRTRRSGRTENYKVHPTHNMEGSGEGNAQKPRQLFPGVGGAAAASLLDELKAKQQKKSSNRSSPPLPAKQQKEPTGERDTLTPPPIPPHISPAHRSQGPGQANEPKPTIPTRTHPPPVVEQLTADVDKPPPIPRRPKLKPRPHPKTERSATSQKGKVAETEKAKVAPAQHDVEEKRQAGNHSVARPSTQDRAEHVTAREIPASTKRVGKESVASTRTDTGGVQVRSREAKEGSAKVAAAGVLSEARKKTTRKDLTPKEVFEEWQTYYSADNQPYYVNRKTGQTTWTKPEELLTEEESQLQGDFIWVGHEDFVWIPSRILDR